MGGPRMWKMHAYVHPYLLRACVYIYIIHPYMYVYIYLCVDTRILYILVCTVYSCIYTPSKFKARLRDTLPFKKVSCSNLSRMLKHQAPKRHSQTQVEETHLQNPEFFVGSIWIFLGVCIPCPTLYVNRKTKQIAAAFGWLDLLQSSLTSRALQEEEW